MLIFSEVVIMKHTFRTLLGLVLVVFVLAGCSNPAGLEIPEGAKVEFVWGEDRYVNGNSGVFEDVVTRHLSDLHEEGKDNWVFEYPEGYDLVKYNDLYNNNKVEFKKLYEKAFEEAFGTKYYKEGTTIDLKKWTSKARDLVEGCCSQFYFLAEDIGKNYDGIKSLETIEVHNENIKIYIYWKYF